MEITVTVKFYSFTIVTFSSSHGGSPIYESLMVGVSVHSPLSTPHELSQTNTIRIACFFMPLSLYLSAMTPLMQVLEGFPYSNNLQYVIMRLSLLKNEEYDTPFGPPLGALHLRHSTRWPPRPP